MGFNTSKYNSNKFNIETQLTLTCESTSFSLSFTDVSMQEPRRITCESTSFSLSFTDVRPRRLTCESTSFSLSFTDITLTLRRLTAETTSFSLTFPEISSSLRRDTKYNVIKYNGAKYNALPLLRLNCESAPFSLSFTDATLTLRRLTCESASFNLSFTDINMQEPRRLTCETTSYSLNFSDVTFTLRRMLVETTSYNLNFSDVTFTLRRMPVETTSYNLSFTDASLLKQYKVYAETTSYSLSLTDVDFYKDLIIPIETTSYNLSFTDASLLKHYRLYAETTSFNLSYSDVNLFKDYVIPIETTSYSLSFTDASLLKQYKVYAETTSYSLSFTDLTLTYYSGIVPHNIYVLCKTPQNEYLKHKIESGKVDLTWPMPTADLQISKFVPPDSLCTVYINQTTKVFEGVAIDCPKEGRTSSYKLELLGHISPFKPDPPKAGLYLGKYIWETIQLQYLLGSDKPTDNNNELGIIYMANSILFDHLFELYDSDHYIYSWTYYGTTYTISEVFEDVTLMTERENVAALESNSGWYHDTSNNIFYVRTSDDLSPYYHAITSPNIWDGLVPIRLGYIKDQSTTEITYEESTYGDKPLELIEEILYALGLEYEISVRGDVAYLNVAETIGRGSYNNPAMTFASGTNIESVRKIDIANGRYVANTVAVNGYGSGPSQIRSAVHRNMGRGGKFVFINNAAMYSKATALNYATEYLDEMYLPQKEIVFNSNVFSKDIPTQKFVGDIVNVQIDSEKIDQLLRIQKISLNLKDLSAEFTLSDKLITLDQRRNALENAIEKFVNHLEDTQESYQWNWEVNADDGFSRTSTFSIDDDVVSFQKLDIDISYKNWESDVGTETQSGGIHSHGGATGSGGVHSDHTTGLEEDADASEDDTTDISTTSHTHDFTTDMIDGETYPDDITICSHGDHTHTYTTPANTSTTTVNTSSHVHSLDALTLNASGSNQSSVPLTFGVNSCTAANCTKSFYACVDTTFTAAKSDHTHSLSSGTVSADSVNTVSVATGSHQHPQGTTDVCGESQYSYMAGSDHVHPGTSNAANTDEGMYITVVNSSHTHSIAGKSTTANEAFDLGISEEEAISYVFGLAGEAVNCGSNPEMYLTVKVDGTQITGSPFVIGVEGEYTYDEEEDLYELSGSISKTSISDIVTTSGDHTIELSLSNKTSPGEACRGRFTVNVNGRYFIQSITS